MHDQIALRVSKRRWRLAVVATGAMLLAAEGGAVLLEPHLPEPIEWPDQEVATKVAQMDQLVAAGDQVDVVFLGSSVVGQGIDPRAFNSAGDLLAYNAALNGASPRAWEVWAREVVFPRLDPEVVVIGVTSRDLNDGGIAHEEFLTKLQGSDGFRRLSDNRGLVKWLDEAAAISAFWRIRPLLRQPGSTLLDLLGRGEPNSPELGPFGAQITTAAATTYDNSSTWRQFWANRHFNDYSIGGQELEALGSLINASLDQGREVLVVEMPIHNDYLEVQPRGEVAVNQFRAIVEQALASSQAELIDLTNGFAATDFRDPAHLNPDAAGRLAITLAARVATLPSPSVQR